jgi:hypothetical protein
MLIQKDNLWCKGVDGGWKKSIEIDPSSMPKRCITIEVEEDEIRYLWVHHLTQYEPSTGWIKIVFKKLQLSDSPAEIWEDIYTRTEYVKPDSYDEKINDLLTEIGLRNLMVEILVS